MSQKKTSNIYGQVYNFAKEHITSLEQIYPGDHLAYERVKLYWHHVIVEDIDSEAQEINVIHYYNNIKGFLQTSINEGSLAQVMRGNIQFWSKRFYRIVYDQDRCHPPDKVLELAIERVGEARYNPVNHNCEHFCTECKIGEKLSIQVEGLVHNMLATILPTLSRALLEELLKKTVQESIKNMSRDVTKKLGKQILFKLSQTVFQIALLKCVGFVGSQTAWVLLQQNTASVVKNILIIEVQKILRTGTKEIIKAAALNIPGRKIASNNLSPRKVACRMTKSGVLAGVAVELAFAGKDIRDASKMRKSGEITKEEFEETVIKRVVGASVSAPLSVAGSIVGQYLLPIPVVGNVVGGVTGSAAGRVAAAVVSGTVIKARHHVGKLMKAFSWKR